MAFSMAAIASSKESEFTRTLREFEKNLTNEQRNDFKFSTLDDLRAAISIIQSKQASERKMRNFTRMRAFLEAIEQYGKVIEVFGNSSVFVAFIWVRLATIYVPSPIDRQCFAGSSQVPPAGNVFARAWAKCAINSVSTRWPAHILKLLTHY
jgi:hypothetical protein